MALDMTIEQRVRRLENALAELGRNTYGLDDGAEHARRTGLTHLAEILHEFNTRQLEGDIET
jgi:hypothetical protein